MQHRKPPKPPWFDNPGKGNCRWCGYYTGTKQTKWHRECLADYKFIFWPEIARKSMWERSMGFCAGCGELLADRCVWEHPVNAHGEPTKRHIEKQWGNRLLDIQTAKWHLDHIIPLCDFPHDPQNPYAPWRESNLQILCEDCHKAKTAREAGARAKKKREALCDT